MVTAKKKISLKSGSNNTHAILSPSGAGQWGDCAASIVMRAEYPDSSGAAAVRGTAMHTMAETILNHQIQREAPNPVDAEYMARGLVVSDNGNGMVCDPRSEVGKKTKDHVKIDDEMVKMVNGYVQAWQSTLHTSLEFELEVRLELSRVYGVKAPSLDENGDEIPDSEDYVPAHGTGDVVAVMPLGPDEHFLIIGDLKTGRNAVAPLCDQLQIYALGALRKKRRLYNIKFVRLVIYQPLCGGWSEHDISVEELEIYQQNLQFKAAAAWDAWTRGKKGLRASDFNPTQRACKYCPHAENCSATLRANPFVDKADLADEPIPPSVEMSNEQLVEEWAKIPSIRDHIDRIEKAVYARLFRGEKLPGLKMVQGRPGPRQWEDPKVAEDILETARIRRDVFTKSNLLSPAQLEAILAKEKPKVWARLVKVTKQSDGSPTVALASDKRAEYSSVNKSDLDD